MDLQKFGDQSQSIDNTTTYNIPENHLDTSLDTDRKFDIASVVKNHPELLKIITAWEQLPEHLRQAIIAIASERKP